MFSWMPNYFAERLFGNCRSLNQLPRCKQTGYGIRFAPKP
ncbi:hypothetical protein AM1_C0242 (plasmid) [Acaryochloris marina MBIC11017]|uniref:Uncharacterized protein n=2 Tax=Acaryochloris marina TaxID=155978 RepID=A8ZMX6_ACAM1|nr:hypothetical protein AM1_C0242 [Acaryochloris marina MBIC11017]